MASIALTGTVADIPDEELLRRAVINAFYRGDKIHPMKVAVMDRFALGPTYAAQLCRRFGLDPDGVVKQP